MDQVITHDLNELTLIRLTQCSDLQSPANAAQKAQAVLGCPGIGVAKPLLVTQTHNPTTRLGQLISSSWASSNE